MLKINTTRRAFFTGGLAALSLLSTNAMAGVRNLAQLSSDGKGSGGLPHRTDQPLNRANDYELAMAVPTAWEASVANRGRLIL